MVRVCSLQQYYKPFHLGEADNEMRKLRYYFNAVLSTCSSQP